MKLDVSMGMLRPWRGLASLKSSSRGVASPRGISLPCVGTSSGEKGGGRGVACSALLMVSSSSSRGVTRADAPLNLRSRAAFCEGDAILVIFVKRARRGAAHGCPGECFGPGASSRRLDLVVGLRTRRNAVGPAQPTAGHGAGQSSGLSSGRALAAPPAANLALLARSVVERIPSVGDGAKIRAQTLRLA